MNLVTVDNLPRPIRFGNTLSMNFSLRHVLQESKPAVEFVLIICTSRPWKVGQNSPGQYPPGQNPPAPNPVDRIAPT